MRLSHENGANSRFLTPARLKGWGTGPTRSLHGDGAGIAMGADEAAKMGPEVSF